MKSRGKDLEKLGKLGLNDLCGSFKFVCLKAQILALGVLHSAKNTQQVKLE